MAAAAPGSIGVSDAGGGRFTVTGVGLWSPAYADLHFQRLDAMLTAARAAGPPLRILVDLRAAGVQPPDTAERIAHWTQRLYTPADRVAILVGSSVVKMQMRRVAMIATRELFLSEAAALLWLGA